MSLIKKKISKKGKKNWRKNIDVEDIHENIIQQNQLKEQNKQYEQIKKKINKQDQNQLFQIDDQQQIKNIRQPLDPNRFKKKEKEIVELKSDKKLIKQLVDKIKNKDQQQIKEEKQEQIQEWEKLDEGNIKYKHQIKKCEIASVIIPHEGQSYNPSYQKHQELLNMVIQQERDEDQIKVFGSRKKNKIILNQSKKIIKTKNKKHQIILEQQELKKKEKQVKNQVSHLNNIIKEIDDKNKKIQENKIQKLKRKIQIDEDKKKGIVQKNKFGKNKYKMLTPEFQLETELADNFRRMKTQNELNIKERFDSIFRRNLLEKSQPWKAKAKLRVPRFKITDLNRRKDDKEMEQLGNFEGNLEIQ